MKTAQAGWVQVPAKGVVGITNSNPLIGITLTAGVYIEIDQSKLPMWLAPVVGLKWHSRLKISRYTGARHKRVSIQVPYTSGLEKKP
jgi:hypothetical protein